jgi:hypothetical protein
VERFELPNLHALNFLLHESLGGGGTVSLKTDAQGKTLSTAMLRMEVEVDDDLAERALARAGGMSAGPPGAAVLVETAGGRPLTLNRPEKRNALGPS